MASEPIWTSLRDDLLDALDVMSRANGFWYDYVIASPGGMASYDHESDFEKPTVYPRWIGEVAQDATTGAEEATNRSRHYDLFELSVSVKDDEDEHERKAARIRADIHKALMSTDATLGLQRNRGVSRATTYDRGNATTDPVHDGTALRGLVLTVEYLIRWDHTTGDMATA